MSFARACGVYKMIYYVFLFELYISMLQTLSIYRKISTRGICATCYLNMDINVPIYTTTLLVGILLVCLLRQYYATHQPIRQTNHFLQINQLHKQIEMIFSIWCGKPEIATRIPLGLFNRCENPQANVYLITRLQR